MSRETYDLTENRAGKLIHTMLTYSPVDLTSMANVQMIGYSFDPWLQLQTAGYDARFPETNQTRHW